MSCELSRCLTRLHKIDERQANGGWLQCFTELSMMAPGIAIIVRMNFVETSVFTRHFVDLLDDTDYAVLQRALSLNPALGDIIPGSRGIRKLRWAAKGRGKSGGARNHLLLGCLGGSDSDARCLSKECQS
jgi:hypothetical protein